VANLAKHKRTHTGEKPYKCDWAGCEASFADGSHLRRHQKKHENQVAKLTKTSNCKKRQTPKATQVIKIRQQPGRKAKGSAADVPLEVKLDVIEDQETHIQSIDHSNKIVDNTSLIEETIVPITDSDLIDNSNRTTINSDLVEDTDRLVDNSSLIAETNRTVIISNLIEEPNRGVIDSNLIEEQNRTVIDSSLINTTNRSVITSNLIIESNPTVITCGLIEESNRIQESINSSPLQEPEVVVDKSLDRYSEEMIPTSKI
jgi:hypothetical protein